MLCMVYGSYAPETFETSNWLQPYECLGGRSMSSFMVGSQKIKQKLKPENLRLIKPTFLRLIKKIMHKAYEDIPENFIV